MESVQTGQVHRSLAEIHEASRRGARISIDNTAYGIFVPKKENILKREVCPFCDQSLLSSMVTTLSFNTEGKDEDGNAIFITKTIQAHLLCANQNIGLMGRLMPGTFERLSTLIAQPA